MSGPPPPGRRKPVQVSRDSLVSTESLTPGGSLPLLVRPVVEGVDLPLWAGEHRALINEKLERHGALLFRGFALAEPADLEKVVRAISGELAEYTDQSSPRHKVSGNVYTSTDYPHHQPIFLHNENSYASAWPRKLFFFCRVAPRAGGETPIADCRKVYARISAPLRERFARAGVLYVRNFGGGVGLPWQTVFQSQSRAEVEAYCRGANIQIEWLGERLRTRQVRQAVARHPSTGELSWFNHGAFFHVSTLTPPVRDALLSQFAEADLPHNTYYGDGAPIEPEALEEIRAAYRAETVSFPWQRGDLLLIDNMLVAHARAPYEGEREILVAMSEPLRAA
jgi:alpha-ketoglutarate-dependent taurine dioxygenase